MDRHVFIAGQGRAGTTLFYNMLRSTVQGFELPPHEHTALLYMDRPGSFLTKRPFDIFEVPRILQQAEGKKRCDLIISMRDPRDVLISFHKSIPNEYFVGAENCWLVPAGQTPSFTAPGILPTHRAILTIINSGIFPKGVMVVKYEDLVADPESVKDLLAKHLDMEFSGNFSDFHKTDIPERLTGPLNGVRPVEVRKEPKWKKPEHRGRIIDQFTKYPNLHQVLFDFGYENDTKWLEELIKEHEADAN
jgi:hypothetical protein